jgi:CRP/FNR family transcriptional regulator, cyclic AMP receptor protein
LTETRLLAHDPDLGAMVADPDRRRAAHERLIVKELRVAAGHQLDPDALSRDSQLGVLVASGFLSRDITVGGRVSADLSGPEDLLYPTQLEPGGELLAWSVTWNALTSTRLLLLDRDFQERVAAWPEIACALVERARRPGDRAAFAHAVARLPTVDARLLMSLWYLALSWSTVTSDGVRLSVPLSHERIARLIGARRPTITGAASRLRQAGYLEQQRDGSWILFSSEEAFSEIPAAGVKAPSPDAILPPTMSNGRGGRPGAVAARRSLRQMHTRLAEQRELLRLAGDEHREQLERLRDQSDRLRANTELSALGRRARRANDGRSAEPEPAPEPEPAA